MAFKMDLSLLNDSGKTKNPIIQPPEEPDLEVVRHEPEPEIEERYEEHPGSFSLGREDAESFLREEKKIAEADKSISGANASVFTDMARTEIDYGMGEKKEPEAAPAEETAENTIRVFCIGGNENYYRNVLEPLNAKEPDIRFVRYLPNGERVSINAIEALRADVVLVFWKIGTSTALDFWNMIQNEEDDGGVLLRDKFRDRRVIVVSPNDLVFEIKMREVGLEFFVKETNPQRHEVNINDLVDQIRLAYADIENTKKQEQEQEKVEEEIEEQKHEIVPEPEVEQGPEETLSKEEVEQPVPTSEPEPEPEAEPEPEPAAQEEPAPQKRKPPAMIRSGRDKRPEPLQDEESRVIGVYSVSGGAGTTMFATNMASVLAKYSNNMQNNNYRVALVEYNLSCQCIDIFFNMKTEKTLYQLAREVNGLANEDGIVNVNVEQMKPIVSRYMIKDMNSGVEILFGLSMPVEIDQIREGFTPCLIETLKSMYDVVIVDMPSDIAKRPILEALGVIDTMYYLMPMDVASIRNTRKVLSFLKSMFRFSGDRIKVVVNKVQEDNKDFSVKQIYDVLAKDDCVPEGTIPYSEDMISSLNRGAPITMEDPNHPVSRAILSIACGVNPQLSTGEVDGIEEEEKPKKKGFLASLFSGKKKKKKDKGEDEEKPKKKKTSFFGKKKKEPEPEPEPMEQEVSQNEEPEEKPKKKGFLSGLIGKFFGGSKKKKVGVKKKKFGGLLGKGREKSEPEQEEQEARPARQSRLSPARRRRPMSRE